MDDKYEVFIKLLNFLKHKYTPEKVFQDFVSLFAISLSNKVYFNKKNSERYKEIYNSYEQEEQYIFYALSSELIKLFKSEDEPYDILGEIYKRITNNDCLKNMYNKNIQEQGKSLQGVMKLNKKSNNGKLVDVNCGSGAKILAYASTLNIFKLNYKIDLEVTAIDTDIINVFMTYIQLYFYEISAVVILVDERSNEEMMLLYTPLYENEEENLKVA